MSLLLVFPVCKTSGLRFLSSGTFLSVCGYWRIFPKISFCFWHSSNTYVMTLFSMVTWLIVSLPRAVVVSRLAEFCSASDLSNSQSVNEWLPLPWTAVLPALNGKIIIAAPTASMDTNQECVLHVLRAVECAYAPFQAHVCMNLSMCLKLLTSLKCGGSNSKSVGVLLFLFVFVCVDAWLRGGCLIATVKVKVGKHINQKMYEGGNWE